MLLVAFEVGCVWWERTLAEMTEADLADVGVVVFVG